MKNWQTRCREQVDRVKELHVDLAALKKKVEQLRELASHNLDEREKLIVEVAHLRGQGTRLEGLRAVLELISSKPLKPHCCSACALDDDERLVLETEIRHADLVANAIHVLIAAEERKTA